MDRFIKFGLVVQLTSYLSISSNPSYFILVQLLANVPRKAMEGDPSTWAPVTHLADTDGI